MTPERKAAKRLAKELSEQLDKIVKMIIPDDFGQVGLNQQQIQLKTGLFNTIHYFTQQKEAVRENGILESLIN